MIDVFFCQRDQRTKDEKKYANKERKTLNDVLDDIEEPQTTRGKIQAKEFRICLPAELDGGGAAQFVAPWWGESVGGRDHQSCSSQESRSKKMKKSKAHPRCCSSSSRFQHHCVSSCGCRFRGSFRTYGGVSRRGAGGLESMRRREQV